MEISKELFSASKEVYDNVAQESIASILKSNAFQISYSKKFPNLVSTSQNKRYPFVKPTESLSNALKELRTYKVIALPVVDKEVIGMVYLVDVLIALNHAEREGTPTIASIMQSSQQISSLSPIPLILEIFTSTEFKYSIVVDEYLLDQMDLIEFLLNDELLGMDGSSIGGLYKRLPLHSTPSGTNSIDNVEEAQVLSHVLKELRAKSSCVVNGKLYVVNDLLHMPLIPRVVPSEGDTTVKSIYQDCKELGIHYSKSVCSKSDLLALFALHIY
jgi:CBS domain-containing protein